MDQLVIGLSGKIGAGKSTVANRLVSQYGFWRISVSGLLKRIIRRRGIKNPDRGDYDAIARELKELDGDNAVAKLLIAEIRSDRQTKLIVLDSVWSLIDNTFLVESLPCYALVHLHAETQQRLKYVRGRREKPGDATLTLQSLMEQEGFSSELEVGALVQHALLVLNNTGSLRSLNVSVSRMLASVRQQFTSTP